MTPCIKDNDRDQITAEIDGREIRGWSYFTDAERRQKMMMAREFAEGWYQAEKASAAAPGAGCGGGGMSVVEKHTPAPWKVGNLESWEMDGTPFRRVYFPCDHLEIQEAHIRGDNCDANARLIAAAPTMLEALEVVIDAANDRVSDGLGHDLPPAVRSKIEAAIAKARGVSQ